MLTVSLSGSYNDLEYVGNFINCDVAMQYFKENCSKHKAASCTLKEYTLIPPDHVSPSQFDFDSLSANESMSCGFVGVDMRTFTKDK